MAEDNIVNQKVATKLLEKLFHKVEVVENGLLAVDAVADRWYRQRPYDLILVCLADSDPNPRYFSRSGALFTQMDAHMPVMNGYDAICEIRQFEEDNGFSPTPTVLLCLGMGEHQAFNIDTYLLLISLPAMDRHAIHELGSKLGSSIR